MVYSAFGSQEEGSHYTPNVTAVEAAFDILKPLQVTWHKEQAGIIPNTCLEATDGCEDDEPSGNAKRDRWQSQRGQDSRNLYWQLYKSLAAYRMALHEEQKRGIVYDWIVRARFDLAWFRPLPPLGLFSKTAVWFGITNW